jgi:hypothetical protein
MTPGPSSPPDRVAECYHPDVKQGRPLTSDHVVTGLPSRRGGEQSRNTTSPIRPRQPPEQVTAPIDPSSSSIRPGPGAALPPASMALLSTCDRSGRCSYYAPFPNLERRGKPS